MNYAPNAAAAEWLVRQVWPRVRAARPDATLTIVGAHPTRRLCDLARADASIEVTGAVPDVRPYLWKASVAAAPLSVARGLQNKVLEAVAAGLPVIASRAVVEGLPAEVLPACSQADSPDEVVDQILGTLAMAPLERRAIARGAALECLDWRHRLATLDSILSAALRPVRLTA
jgi:glycosyltransferase involved in cell wall biosynthesis